MMQHLLLLSFLVVLITVGGLVFRFRSDLDFSISLNAAKHPLALLWLWVGGLLSIALVVAWYFIWLNKIYDLSLFSTISFLVIAASFAMAITLPDVPGTRRELHRAAGYMAVVGIPVFLLSLTPLLHSLTLYVSWIVIIGCIGMMYLLFFVKSALKYLLQFQALYIASFFLVLLLLTYAR